MRRQGPDVSHCQVDPLMRQEGLNGLRRGKQQTATVRYKTRPSADDLLGRSGALPFVVLCSPAAQSLIR